MNLCWLWVGSRSRKSCAYRYVLRGQSFGFTCKCFQNGDGSWANKSVVAEYELSSLGPVTPFFAWRWHWQLVFPIRASPSFWSFAEIFHSCFYPVRLLCFLKDFVSFNDYIQNIILSHRCVCVCVFMWYMYVYMHAHACVCVSGKGWLFLSCTEMLQFIKLMYYLQWWNNL